jgi:hypothetical protein
MKNKLLLSSALVGSLIAGSAAIAQTTVTGNLAINYRAQSFDAPNAISSARGFGRETQVNVQNKGKLNNGLDYAAGFSLEFDGNNRPSTTSGAQGMGTSTEGNSISNENVYVDFISGNTTVTIGVDHIQNITTSAVPQIFDVMDNVAAGIGGKATNTVGANAKESMGFGIMQNIPGTGLRASLNYVPTYNGFGTGDQNALDGTNSNNSAYEYGVVGVDAFGVKGLGLRYFANKSEAASAALTDIEGKHYGISYSTGAFAVGVEKHSQNRTTSGTTSDAADQISKTYSATYAVNKDLSLGITHIKTDIDTAVDEKITSVQVGYNLGAVAAVLAYSNLTDIGNEAAKDAKELQFRITAAF